MVRKSNDDGNVIEEGFENEDDDNIRRSSKTSIEDELKNYLTKISDEALYAYNVYQIEGEGRHLFSKIEGNENTIMGLPIDKIKDYLKNYE